jgi:AcrR family transcriptional regulator
MDKTARRAEILARARDVFAKRGYHAAKIDHIVNAAGVARGTFYLYFEDKRAVFAELVDRFIARLHIAIMRIDPDDRSRSVGDQIRENTFRVLSIFLTDRAMTKILLTDAPGLDVEFDRKLQAVYEGVHTLLAESLAEGQALGIVAPGDTRVFAYLTVGALKEVLYQSVIGDFGRERARALTDAMFAFLQSGYLRIADESASRPTARRSRRAQ